MRLAWDANAELTLAGYHLLIGTVSGQPTATIDTGRTPTVVVSGLTLGQTYYFAVTAYDSFGSESPRSGEVSYRVPGTYVPPAATPIPSATPTPAPTATPFPSATPANTVSRGLTINIARVNVGQTVEVTLSGGFQNPTDSIDLFPVGGSSRTDFFYLNGSKTQPLWGSSSGTVSFVMPSAGQFEFRYHSGSYFFATSPSVTVDPNPTPTPPAAPAATPTPVPAATPVAASFSNVSTRAYVRTGDGVLIGGLIISGDVPKKVVLRAIGPSLVAAGLSDALRDPTLSIYNSAGLVASNDNWRSNAAAVQATGLAPASDYESVIVTTLAPGAYTAIVAGASGTDGIALFELYDAAPANARIGNISTRGKIEGGNNVMIGGFIVAGAQPSQVVIRVLGPSLGNNGVVGALADPALDLYNSNGSQIFTNDNWRSSQEQQIAASGLAPNDDRESAIIATLQPGNYTAIARGAQGSTGVGLIEVYNLSR